jgi:outer membrane protein assembly factor BamB
MMMGHEVIRGALWASILSATLVLGCGPGLTGEDESRKVYLPELLLRAGPPGYGTSWVAGLKPDFPGGIPEHELFLDAFARGGSVFVVVRRGGCYCGRLDERTGELLWMRRLPEPDLYSVKYRFVPTERPLPIILVVDRRGMYLTGPVAVALDEDTGEELWRSDISAAASAFDLGGDRLFLSAGGRVSVGGCEFGLACIEARSGKIQWAQWSEERNSGDVGPLVLGASEKFICAFDPEEGQLSTYSASSGERLWHTEPGDALTMAVAGDLLVRIFADRAEFLDMRGQRVSEDVRFPMRFGVCLPCVVGDTLLLTALELDTASARQTTRPAEMRYWFRKGDGPYKGSFAAALDLKTKRLLWARGLPFNEEEKPWCAYLDAERAIFASSESGTASAHRLATGEIIWSRKSPLWKDVRMPDWLSPDGAFLFWGQPGQAEVERHARPGPWLAVPPPPGGKRLYLLSAEDGAVVQKCSLPEIEDFRKKFHDRFRPTVFGSEGMPPYWHGGVPIKTETGLLWLTDRFLYRLDVGSKE